MLVCSDSVAILPAPCQELLRYLGNSMAPRKASAPAIQNKPLQDISGMKMNERYGFMAIEQGRGVATAKNVVIDRNYGFQNTNAVTLPALDDGLSDGDPTFV